jgi:Flp pilus assembly protein TadD
MAIALHATARSEGGDPAGGVSELKRATAAAPNDPDLLLALAGALRRARRAQEAQSVVGQILSSNPRNLEAMVLYGFCLIDQRQYQQALPYLQQAIALSPEVANYHQKLGMIHQGLENFPLASISYKRALELDPSNPSTYSNLGQVLMELRQYETAVNLMETAIKLRPNQAEYYVLLARALTGAERTAGIEVHLEKAVELKRDFAVAHRMLAYRYLELGRFEAAEVHFKRALELKPGQAALYEGIASCRKFTAEDSPLIREMEELLNAPIIHPEQRRHVLYALGKYHNDVNEFEAAFRLFDEGNALMNERLRDRPFNRKLFSYLLNGFIQSFDKDFFVRHSSLGSSSERPVLVVGVIRSGTTMLEEILARHGRIAAGGELHYWHRSLTGPGNEEIRDISPEHAEILKRGYLRVLDEISPDSDRVIDKMPQNFMLLGWIHALFPKAKIVVCRRQPVDIALSIWMTSFGEAIEFAHDKKNVVHYIKEFNRLMEHWMSVIPGETITEVWYEDIVNDQETEIRRLVKFLGLEWDPACLQPQMVERRINTPSMWQARQKLYRSSVERWRHYETWLGEFSELLK